MPVQIIRTRGLAAVIISVGTLAASLVITHSARGVNDGSGFPHAATVTQSSTPTSSPTSTYTPQPASVRWGGLNG